jgi:hypothetical protein
MDEKLLKKLVEYKSKTAQLANLSREVALDSQAIHEKVTKLLDSEKAKKPKKAS